MAGRVFDKLVSRHASLSRMAVHATARGETTTLTYSDLRHTSLRRARVLAESFGVTRGDRVGVLLENTHEVPISCCALWAIGATMVPLFPLFGADAISYRLRQSGAKVVLTSSEFAPAVDAAVSKSSNGVAEASLSAAYVDDHNFVGQEKDADNQVMDISDVHDYSDENGDMLALLFTSGTTGQPKGVPIPAGALPAFEQYMRQGLDASETDTHWNVASPMWAYGLYYNILGNMLVGNTRFSLHTGGAFDAKAHFDFMRQHNLTNIAGSPTAYKILRAFADKEKSLQLPSLHKVSSAGEPLNQAVTAWSERQLGAKILDHYGQTEHGMVVGNWQTGDHPHPVPGSMGVPMDGFTATISNDELVILPEQSSLYWFQGYLGRGSPVEDGVVRTGDKASQDEHGRFFFASRMDDVITSSGFRLGPFEIEEALMSDSRVVEAAVVGEMDDKRGEIVVAYIILKEEETASEETVSELQQLVIGRVGKHAVPRRVNFVQSLPKTESGKVQRHILRKNSA